MEKSNEVLKIFPTTAREEDEDLELGTNLPELGVVGHRSTRTITNQVGEEASCRPSLKLPTITQRRI